MTTLLSPFSPPIIGRVPVERLRINADFHRTRNLGRDLWTSRRRKKKRTIGGCEA